VADQHHGEFATAQIRASADELAGEREEVKDLLGA